MENFALGGGYGSDDRIFQYKQCLAPRGVVDFYNGKQIFHEKVYDELVQMRGEGIQNREYFPLYRG